MLRTEGSLGSLSDGTDPVLSEAVVFYLLLHLLFMRLSLNPVGARRQDNEGFHETELEIEDKDRKEEPAGYSPALMSLPNHSRPSERTKVNMNKPKLLIREVAMML